jgi:hypothetical protein
MAQRLATPLFDWMNIDSMADGMSLNIHIIIHVAYAVVDERVLFRGDEI